MWMNQQQPEQVVLLDMEQKLLDDAAGNYRDQLLEDLNQAASELRRSLQTGASPDEYTTNANLLAAVESATGVVNRVWSKNHP